MKQAVDGLLDDSEKSVKRRTGIQDEGEGGSMNDLKCAKSTLKAEHTCRSDMLPYYVKLLRVTRSHCICNSLTIATLSMLCAVYSLENSRIIPESRRNSTLRCCATR